MVCESENQNHCYRDACFPRAISDQQKRSASELYYGRYDSQQSVKRRVVGKKWGQRSQFFHEIRSFKDLHQTVQSDHYTHAHSQEQQPGLFFHDLLAPKRILV